MRNSVFICSWFLSQVFQTVASMNTVISWKRSNFGLSGLCLLQNAKLVLLRACLKSPDRLCLCAKLFFFFLPLVAIIRCEEKSRNSILKQVEDRITGEGNAGCKQKALAL